MKYLKGIKTAYICAGVLFSIMGLVLIIFPQISMNAICCIIGAFAIMIGAIKICAYFSDDRYNIAFQFDLALGILAIIIGIIFIAKTNWVLSFFSTIIGIIMTASSLFSVQASIDSKKFGLKAWGALLAISVISMALGILLIFCPIESLSVLARLYGLGCVLEGISKIITAAYTTQKIRDFR